MQEEKILEKCKLFINNFCENCLNSTNIEVIKDFCFMDLKLTEEISNIQDINEKYCKITTITNDDIKKKYGLYFLKDGKPKYKRSYEFEDCDDMNLARAIYFIIYYDKVPENKLQDLWNSLNWEDNGCNTNLYRGETINTFNTLFTDNFKHKMFYLDYFENTDLKNKITIFRRKLFTLGNFMILPNISLNNNITLNKYKGCKLGDYFDLFLECIKNKNKNPDINELIKINKELFDFNFENFISNNYLEDYINSDFNFSEHFKYWQISEEQKTEYEKFVEEYIKIVEDKINKRADRLIKVLKK